MNVGAIKPAGPGGRPSPFACPRCRAPATPSAEVQRCAQCGKPFTLRAGCRGDASVVPPPPDPRLPRITVKSAGVFLMKRGVVAPEGVSEGTLDPIIGMVPMDQNGVYFNDVIAVSVWRRVDGLRLGVGLVIPTPIAAWLLFLAIAAKTAVLVIVALPFLLSAAWLIYRATAVKVNLVRVVGSIRNVEVRFDAPLWNRRRFHDELLRRAGISPSPIP